MGTEEIVIRVVLDTNVIVSALILHGSSNQLVHFWKENKFKLVVSKEIIDEYLRVLTYPKFKLSSEEIKSIVKQEILPFIEPVKIKEIPRVIHEDPSDDVFLACAKEGKCQYLVSGDRHLLSLKQYEKIPILSVHTFLKLLTGKEIS